MKQVKPVSEEEIVQALRRQDERVLKTVYKQHYPQIANMVVNNGGSVQEAKDIYQETIIVFYEKMLAAFNAGYYIVPNFPVTLFAIKTTKPTPKRMWARLRSENRKNFQQHPEVLPAGEGEYQNPNPIVTKSYSSFLSDQQKGDTWAFEATEWDEMEFPANMARVHVMEAATRAMDEKIFDEVAFLPQDHKRNPDPLLIGRIIDPRPAAYYGGQRRVSFMLAWHIDTRTL